MLILSRKAGETIELPSLGVRIQVTETKKSRTTIGIDAPGDVEILRGEKVLQTQRVHSSVPERLLNDQLIALEAGIIALSEMASSEHHRAAKITARESLSRLRQLRRQQEQESNEVCLPKPLGDFVAVRSEVLHYLKQDHKGSVTDPPPEVVQQANVGYVMSSQSQAMGASRLNDCDTFKETNWDPTGYQVA